MTVDPEVYYSCSDCVLSFVKEAPNGAYVEATTDHAMCTTGCRSKATLVCRVYSYEPESDLKEEPEESCMACCNTTVTEDTLFKAHKAIMRVFPAEEIAGRIINELLNDGILFRERI